MYKVSQGRITFWIGTVLLTVMAQSIAVAFWTVFPIKALSVVGDLIAVSLLIVSILGIRKTSEPVHFLRWQFSTMVASVLIQLGLIFAIRRPDELPFPWMLASPFLLISTYSFIQSKRLNGGKQLELPTNVVHSFSRLNWRWFTAPKLDFWVCWLGLIIPFVASCFIFQYAINEPYSDTLLTILRLGWLGSCGAFLFFWIRQIFVHDRSAKIEAFFVYNKNFGLAMFATYMMRRYGLFNGLVEVSWIYFVLDFFVNAYHRSIVRQTPSGIGEYEALEGPSLGL